MVNSLLGSLLIVSSPYLLVAPAWVYAWRRGTLWFWDPYLPAAAPVFWAVLASAGVGHQSLSHLLELPIVVVAVAMIYSVRVFVLDQRSESPNVTAAATAALAMAVPLLVRLFMPYMPE
ncbi:MAG: hypothetical protein AVDCRST_MAG89-4751 [uncultured Gemmatimonadetes bacterium]|uniref:Uncharacterized protein n=1 Tax=uncultured Gemmatimonadota bacterium TaxID=203437 RepID=A0A6J4N385_9BACT|nr:MAG: hypothetical protein AVDCRST_MAG89-4751 [uncultured Gemmatimonadota bacterium]